MKKYRITIVLVIVLFFLVTAICGRETMAQTMYFSDKQSYASIGDTGNEELNALCDDILASLISDSMSEREKAYAIYTWVTSSIRYRGNFDMSDWRKGAITVLKKRRGNCFAFYSASRALLTRAGFENMEIKEEPDYHFWNLVKVDGYWYHFDTTRGWGTERFLWTDKQMRKYRLKLRRGGYLRYKWDASKYPATPK